MLAEGSAAHLASAVAENVQYHGRKAIRRRSEVRRQAILDAAMRIIVREGVRAVRHRAVAAEAQVPLSATTYYFKDISDLITDTFALYVERSAARLADFWQGTHGMLLPQTGQLDGSVSGRRQLVERISVLLSEYVQTQLDQHREALQADQAFRQEALRNPHLAALVCQHQEILVRGVTHFFELLGSPRPQQDATLLTGIITQMEYQGLLDGVECLERNEMQAVFRRYMHLVLGLDAPEAVQSSQSRRASEH